MNRPSRTQPATLSRSELTMPVSPLASTLLDRRRLMSQSATALGGMALAHLLQRDGALVAGEEGGPIRPRIDPANPNNRREPHFPAPAKQVLMIFNAGACSHLDTFDYKPEIGRAHV